VQVALDISRSARAERTVGVTSTCEGEGKTTVAANLARLIANAGIRTLLVDCNYQNPALSSLFSPDAVIGLVDMLDREDSALSDLLWVDPRTGMHFLPIGGQDKRQQKSQLIWSSLMPRLIGQLDQAYDYVIFDLPPVTPMADVRAASELLDRVLLVIQWGTITAEHLQASLLTGGSLPLKLLGTVLNKAELSALPRLSSLRASLLSQRVDTEASAAPITSPLRRPCRLEQANTER
jgi:Mrp family chromosome partitioning ATPase